MSNVLQSCTLGWSVGVQLVLVNISDELTKDAEDFKTWVESDVLACPVPAQQLLVEQGHLQGCGDDALLVREERLQQAKAIQKQVLKYLQLKDKYTALTSMLLKSQSFHCRYPRISKSIKRAVVELPRTPFQKPYIPLLPSSVKTKGKEEDVFPLSISHQFPFVGLVQFDDYGDVGNDRSDPSPAPGSQQLAQHVGLDVVVFDDYNPRVYDNQEEFIDTFREYFTAQEWEWIYSVDTIKNGRLQEFYLRWSIKEAYTKALGVGMGMRFDSFEFHLQEQSQYNNEGGVSSSLGCKKCPSDVIRASPQQPSHFSARVEHLDDSETPKQWLISFLPLYKGPKPSLMSGCACICAGPIPLDSNAVLKPRVHWTNLDALVNWHLNP